MLLSNGVDMEETQNQTSLPIVFIIALVIVAFFTTAIMFFPKSISNDTTIIGKGSNVAVLAHNKESVQSLTLIELMNKVRTDYAGRVEFVVADIDTPQGRKFIADQQVDAGTLLLFGADGTRRQVVSNINNQSILRSALDAAFN